MRLRFLAPALAALLVLGLSSCSDDPVPIVEPTPTEAPASPTPTPTPDATSTPEPVPERETAAEFIRRWQEAAYLMQVSGDVEAYLRFTQGCESCQNFVETVEGIYGDGGSIELERPKVGGIQKVGESQGTTIVEFDTVAGRTNVLDEAGQISQELPGGRTRFQANLIQSAKGGWIVTRISELVQ